MCKLIKKNSFNYSLLCINFYVYFTRNLKNTSLLVLQSVYCIGNRRGIANCKINMKKFKFNLLIMDVFLIIVVQQCYELKTTSRFLVSNCTEKKVDSMLSCAAIGRVAKCVTYLFNVDEYLCLWNCNFF